MVVNSERIDKILHEKILYGLLSVVAIFGPVNFLMTFPRIMSGELSEFLWFFIAAHCSAPIVWFCRKSLSLGIIAGYIITLIGMFILYNSFRQGLFGVNTVALALLAVMIITLFEKYAVRTALIVVIVFLTILGGIHFSTNLVVPKLDEPISILGALALRFVFLSMLIVICHQNYNMYRRQAAIAESNSSRLQLANDELEMVINENKILKELVSVCSYCGLVKDPEDEDSWSSMEKFIQKKTTLNMSHGMCPKCFDKNMKPFS